MLSVLGISGSLRKGSYNSALLRAAAGHLPDGMSLSTADISTLPLFNEDLEAIGMPEPVRIFREQVRTADAVLISSPEYNGSIPGGLKNALDWASRGRDQPFDKKPVALMGATPGALGTARCQQHLRVMFVGLNSFVMPNPQLYMAGAAQKVGPDGEVTDEGTLLQLAKLLTGLRDWVERVR